MRKDKRKERGEALVDQRDKKAQRDHEVKLWLDMDQAEFEKIELEKDLARTRRNFCAVSRSGVPLVGKS